ncbi:hypothetical protein SNEBB_003261 [Seison nebaliae]|nr:hypothetical protein SNEBB_003261 [Seison nebaliae]
MPKNEKYLPDLHITYENYGKVLILVENINESLKANEYFVLLNEIRRYDELVANKSSSILKEKTAEFPSFSFNFVRFRYDVIDKNNLLKGKHNFPSYLLDFSKDNLEATQYRRHCAWYHLQPWKRPFGYLAVAKISVDFTDSSYPSIIQKKMKIIEQQYCERKRKLFEAIYSSKLIIFIEDENFQINKIINDAIQPIVQYDIEDLCQLMKNLKETLQLTIHRKKCICIDDDTEDDNNIRLDFEDCKDEDCISLKSTDTTKNIPPVTSKPFEDSISSDGVEFLTRPVGRRPSRIDAHVYRLNLGETNTIPEQEESIAEEEDTYSILDDNRVSLESTIFEEAPVQQPPETMITSRTSTLVEHDHDDVDAEETTIIENLLKYSIYINKLKLEEWNEKFLKVKEQIQTNLKDNETMNEILVDRSDNLIMFRLQLKLLKLLQINSVEKMKNNDEYLTGYWSSDNLKIIQDNQFNSSLKLCLHELHEQILIPLRINQEIALNALYRDINHGSIVNQFLKHSSEELSRKLHRESSIKQSLKIWMAQPTIIERSGDRFKVENKTFYFLPFEESLITSFHSNKRSYSKRLQGRSCKMMGDSLLINGNIAEALIMYEYATTLLKSVRDNIWLYSATMGIIVATTTMRHGINPSTKLYRNFEKEVNGELYMENLELLEKIRKLNETNEFRLKYIRDSYGLSNILDSFRSLSHLLNAAQFQDIPMEKLQSLSQEALKEKERFPIPFLQTELFLIAISILYREGERRHALLYLSLLTTIRLPSSTVHQIERIMVMTNFYRKFDCYRKMSWFGKIVAFYCAKLVSDTKNLTYYEREAVRLNLNNLSTYKMTNLTSYFQYLTCQSENPVISQLMEEDKTLNDWNKSNFGAYHFSFLQNDSNSINLAMEAQLEKDRSFGRLFWRQRHMQLTKDTLSYDFEVIPEDCGRPIESFKKKKLFSFGLFLGEHYLGFVSLQNWIFGQLLNDYYRCSRQANVFIKLHCYMLELYGIHLPFNELNTLLEELKEAVRKFDNRMKLYQQKTKSKVERLTIDPKLLDISNLLQLRYVSYPKLHPQHILKNKGMIIPKKKISKSHRKHPDFNLFAYHPSMHNTEKEFVESTLTLHVKDNEVTPFALQLHLLNMLPIDITISNIKIICELDEILTTELIDCNLESYRNSQRFGIPETSLQSSENTNEIVFRKCLLPILPILLYDNFKLSVASTNDNVAPFQQKLKKKLPRLTENFKENNSTFNTILKRVRPKRTNKDFYINEVNEFDIILQCRYVGLSSNNETVAESRRRSSTTIGRTPHHRLYELRRESIYRQSTDITTTQNDITSTKIVGVQIHLNNNLPFNIFFKKQFQCNLHIDRLMSLPSLLSIDHMQLLCDEENVTPKIQYDLKTLNYSISSRDYYYEKPKVNSLKSEMQTLLVDSLICKSTIQLPYDVNCVVNITVLKQSNYDTHSKLSLFFHEKNGDEFSDDRFEIEILNKKEDLILENRTSLNIKIRIKWLSTTECTSSEIKIIAFRFRHELLENESYREFSIINRLISIRKST